MSDYTPPNKLSDQEILEDVKQASEKTDDLLTIEKYREHGNYSAWPVQNRFGWNNAKEKVGLKTVEKGEGGTIKPENMLQDIQEKDEKVEGILSSTIYKEKGEYSLQTISNAFGSWIEAAEEAGIEHLKQGEARTPVKKLEEIEEYLQQRRGRFRIKQLRELPDEKIQKNQVSGMFEWLNERENGLEVHVSTGNPTVFIENEARGRYDEYYEVLPDDTVQVFDAVMSDSTGFSPKSVASAILYIYDQGLTQSKAADKIGCTVVSLRKARNYLQEKGHAETIEEAGN